MLRLSARVSGLSPVLRNPPASPFDKEGIGIKGVETGKRGAVGCAPASLD